jgi:hypothetical protein
LWCVIKFEDETKFLWKMDYNNRHFNCNITYTWLPWLETSPQQTWLPMSSYLLILPNVPVILWLRERAKEFHAMDIF